MIKVRYYTEAGEEVAPAATYEAMNTLPCLPPVGGLMFIYDPSELKHMQYRVVNIALTNKSPIASIILNLVNK